MIKRVLKHMLMPGWAVARKFPKPILRRITAAIRESEALHRGELRLAVEGGLDLLPLLHGVTPRERAIRLFSDLRVWDTGENSGVLIYLQLVDRSIEIVADRGINARVEQAQWNAICRRMEKAFAAGDYEGGTLQGIREITGLLAAHFPAGSVNPDELPDSPVIL
jgi:hypothetical protein